MNGCIIDNGRRGQQYSHHHYTAIRFAIRMITFGPITVKYPNCGKTLSTVDASNHFVRCPHSQEIVRAVVVSTPREPIKWERIIKHAVQKALHPEEA